jgi:hypothetical protein
VRIAQKTVIQQMDASERIKATDQQLQRITTLESLLKEAVSLLDRDAMYGDWMAKRAWIIRRDTLLAKIKEGR